MSTETRSRYALPIRARLTLWYALTLAVVVAGLGVTLVIELRSGLRDRAHESLEGPYRVIEAQLSKPGGPTLRQLLHQPPPAGEGPNEVIGQILDRQGRVVSSSGDPGALTPMVSATVLADAARVGQWHESRQLPGRGHEDIVVVAPLREGPWAGNFVALAQTLAPSDALVSHVVDLLLALSPLILAIALIGGWRIASAGLRPVDTLTRSAAAIDPAQSDASLPLPPRNDEIGRLARTLNGMLGRLRRALQAERRFTADASHELRTPLALMRAELEVALRSPKTPASAQPVLRSIDEEATRLSRIVENLLVLSRAEAAGEVALALRDADLLDLAVEVAGRFRVPAADRGVQLKLAGEPAMVSVDADLLEHALGNLVDNALKFSPRDTRVEVLVADGDEPSIEVVDHGPGIASDQIPLLFDRFYRTEEGRRLSSSGSGLGLSIVRSIVEAHGGRLEVQSSVGEGSRFTIRLRR